LNFFLYNHYLSEYILAHKREKRNPFLKELRFEINLDEIARCAGEISLCCRYRIALGSSDLTARSATAATP